MTQKTTVIHHSADFDGLFCREIARKFLPDAELIGWYFGDAPIPIPAEGQIYVLDLPVDRVAGLTFGGEGHLPWLERVIWIDHHQSSIKTHNPTIPGYRIDGVAACRLAWQWFQQKLPFAAGIECAILNLPTKQEFVDRKVTEPWAVRLAGEYDIWDKRDPDAELFQHGLRSRELTPEIWTFLLTQTKNRENITVLELLEAATALHYAQTRQNESIIKDLGFTFHWEGLVWLACNHARYNSNLFTAGLKPEHARYNSNLFTAGLKPEHDACFGFKFTGHCAGGKPCGQWSISLYHAPGKEHHDLSAIATKYGGGGHKGACGFQADELPFLL